MLKGLRDVHIYMPSGQALFMPQTPDIFGKDTNRSLKAFVVVFAVFNMFLSRALGRFSVQS